MTAYYNDAHGVQTVTRDEILEIALEAGAELGSQVYCGPIVTIFNSPHELERFADLIIERCAKICEVTGLMCADIYGDGAECISTANECAAAILALAEEMKGKK